MHIDPVLEPPERQIEPRFDVVRAARAELGVTDLDRARHFYVEALGFHLTDETDDALYLRGMEEASHHSLVLRLARAPMLLRAGFRVARSRDLEAGAEHFRALGCEPVADDAHDVLGLGRRILVTDPLGFPVELFHDIASAERLLQRFDQHRGGRVMRIDHFNFMVPAPEVAREYYRHLGFRTTELIADAEGRAYGVWMTRKPFVHDVALTRGAGPRLHHIGFTAPDATSVMHLCDVLGAMHLEGHIERGPGRHGVSNAFYLYLRDPDGHRIEIYLGDYYTGDPDHRALRWSVGDSRRRSFWGHDVPDSWYREASLVQGTSARSVAVEPAEAFEVIAAMEERT